VWFAKTVMLHKAEMLLLHDTIFASGGVEMFTFRTAETESSVRDVLQNFAGRYTMLQDQHIQNFSPLEALFEKWIFSVTWLSTPRILHKYN
jgi:hypothetical protein